jgi:hypothetical protein
MGKITLGCLNEIHQHCFDLGSVLCEVREYDKHDYFDEWLHVSEWLKLAAGIEEVKFNRSNVN